ncbi:protein FAM149B1-like isoform X2 [Acanthaster planci]|uniref:Protein FAM149B1-like isoform X2 n=1 Tax=Acanthaster planci TaxID=133434 RepID=A0A8B7YDS5_ACAPL|nr:protein FAM149B1-like isoform X2 [Acanthaster planci]
MKGHIMAGKKTRNRNILSLDRMEIRGISSRSDNYPSLERPDDLIPMHYLNSVNEAINSYVTPCGSGMSSPSDDERPSFLLMSNSGGLTSGNSTERSSLFSWADDEFDKQASKTVQRMFQEIDDMLFEGQKNATTSVQLENECKEWNSRFPHLRILGQQLITPCDLGYQFVSRTAQRPTTAEELVDIGENEYPSDSSQDPQGLCIVGTCLRPLDPVATMGSSRDETVRQQLADMEEEILESDGVIEEYFAYDRLKPWEEDSHEQKRYHAPRRTGFPPLTPNACVQNSIYSQCFDVMWTEVVGWMRLLLTRHWELQSEIKKFSNPEDVTSSVSVLHPVQPSFDLSYSPYPFGSHLGRGLLDGPSNKLAPMGSGRLNTAPSLNSSLVDRQNLTGVMTISSKALHNRPNDKDTRAPSVLGEELQTLPLQIGIHVNRPGSSANRSNRPTSVKTTDNYNYRLTSARGRGRLRPIDRAKTPNMEGIITGKRLTTASDRLGSPPHPGVATSPPYHWSRNTALPPIETVQEMQTKQDGHGNENKPSNNSSSRSSAKFRISSAAADDRGLRLKDRSATFISESRPNTTHTFRSDTPFGVLNRRSSTPQSFSLFKSTAAAPPAVGNPGIMTGITGISIGIPGSSTHMDAPVNQYGNTQAGYFKVL